MKPRYFICFPRFRSDAVFVRFHRCKTRVRTLTGWRSPHNQAIDLATALELQRSRPYQVREITRKQAAQILHARKTENRIKAPAPWPRLKEPEVLLTLATDTQVERIINHERQSGECLNHECKHSHD